MSNPSKRKGSQYEADVAAYLVEHGFPNCERRVTAGANDKGDLAGISGWTLELKNEKAISLSSYLMEAKVEAANAGTHWYAAVIKKRNANVKDSYVVMPLHLFTELIGGGLGS